MAERRVRELELEEKIAALKHNDLGLLLIEYLHLDERRLFKQLVSENSEINRGKIQKVGALLKIFGAESLT